MPITTDTDEQRLVQQAKMLTNDLAELQRIALRASNAACTITALTYVGAQPRVEALHTQAVVVDCQVRLDLLRNDALDKLAGPNPEPEQWTR